MPGWFAKIDRRMWGDAKFRQLSPMPCSGQALWIWLLTGGSNFGCAGLLYLGAMGIADKTKWPIKSILEALAELEELNMISADHDNSTILIRKLIDYNPPCNSNTVKGWLKRADLVPEGPLVNEWKRILSNYLEEKAWWDETGIEIRFETTLETNPNPPKNKNKNKNKNEKGDARGEKSLALPSASASSPVNDKVEKDRKHEEGWVRWKTGFAAKAKEQNIPEHVASGMADALEAAIEDGYALSNGKFTPLRRAKLAKALEKYKPLEVMVSMEIFIDKCGGKDERYFMGIVRDKAKRTSMALDREMGRHRASMAGSGIAAELGVSSKPGVK